MGYLKVYYLIPKSSTVVRENTLFPFRTLKIVETHILSFGLFFLNHGYLIQQSQKSNSILSPVLHNVKVLEYFKANQFPIYLHDIVFITVGFCFCFCFNLTN